MRSESSNDDAKRVERAMRGGDARYMRALRHAFAMSARDVLSGERLFAARYAMALRGVRRARGVDVPNASGSR